MPANLWVEDGYVEAGWIQSGITVDWPTATIHIPKAVLVLLQSSPVEVRTMDADWFHLQLRDLQTTPEGRGGWPRTHDYDAESDLSGTTFALKLKILPPYTITFEDGPWNVEIIGGNTNISSRVNKNSVGVGTANSAGLQTVEVGSGLSTEQALQLEQIHGQVRREIWLDESLVSPLIANGYQKTPYNIINNAIDDLEANGIQCLNSKSDMELARDLKNITLTGVGVPSPKLNAKGFSLKGMKLWNMQLEGLSTDPFIVQQSYILQGAGLQGTSELCVFKGDAILTGNLEIINGVSGKEGAGFIWLNTNGFILQVTNWTRSLGVQSMTAGIHTIHMDGGQFHLDAECSGGVIYLRGTYSLPPDDQSTGTIVIDQTDTKKILDIQKVMDLDINDPNIYAEDGSFITNSKWTLTKVPLGNGTFKVQLTVL